MMQVTAARFGIEDIRGFGGGIVLYNALAIILGRSKQ